MSTEKLKLGGVEKNSHHFSNLPNWKTPPIAEKPN